MAWRTYNFLSRAENKKQLQQHTLGQRLTVNNMRSSIYFMGCDNCTCRSCVLCERTQLSNDCRRFNTGNVAAVSTYYICVLQCSRWTTRYVIYLLSEDSVETNSSADLASFPRIDMLLKFSTYVVPLLTGIYEKSFVVCVL